MGDSPRFQHSNPFVYVLYDPTHDYERRYVCYVQDVRKTLSLNNN